MSARSRGALSGGVQGAAAGASVGSGFGPWGALIGAGAGGLLGAIGGTDAAAADEPYDLLDLQQGRLGLEQGKLDLRVGQRNFKNMMMQDRGQENFRKYLSAAFRGVRPASFSEAMGQ